MMTPTDLHKYLLERANYDLPLSSIYRMLRQKRIEGQREPIPRSTKYRWMVSQEEADNLVIEYRGYPATLSPSIAVDRRPKTGKVTTNG